MRRADGAEVPTPVLEYERRFDTRFTTVVCFDQRFSPPCTPWPVRLWREGWSAAVVRFGLLISCCLLAEGAVVHWGAVFLNQERGAAPAVATLAYLAFSVMMALGRVAGDRLTSWLGQVVLVRAGAVIAAVGLTLALVVPQVAGAIVAFGVCGAGISVLVPTIFSAVGRESSRADASGAAVGSSMARAVTLGYLGVLVLLVGGQRQPHRGGRGGRGRR